MKKHIEQAINTLSTMTASTKRNAGASHFTKGMRHLYGGEKDTLHATRNMSSVAKVKE